MRDLALAAIREVADSVDHVGDFIDEVRLDDVLIVRFASLHPGYPHWHWSAALCVTGDHATVNEVWMEPGEGALAVPEWKPWSERVRPGDLGVGDVVPTDPDDSRLEPGYTGADADAEQLRPAQWELGLGRERVLSAAGLADAAERWRRGDDGPDAQIARVADFQCSTCAWMLPIGGLLGQAFGVCAHDMSPSDGHIVSLDHGCGAHSDAKAEPTPIPVTDMLVDETQFALLDLGSASLEPTATTDDVLDAEEAHGHAGEGDVTPPEDVVVGQEAGEDEAEQREDGPDDGADDARLDAVEVQPAQMS